MLVKNFAQFGETRFASLCSEYGARCQPVSDDAHGWDSLVEFAEEPHEGPADTAPADLAAYVQVKTTRGASRETQIKFSNMLRAARSKQPWFVFLFVLAPGDSQPTIYAKHFWRELMSVGLKAAQECQRDGRPLNRKKVTIKFNDDDRIPPNLVEWMLQCIRSVKPSYESEKVSLYSTLGFGDVWGRGTFSFESVSLRQLQDGMLGLGDGLPTTDFIFTRERFGIPDVAPVIEERRGIVKFEPLTQSQCTLTVRRADGEESPIRLNAKTYAASVPSLDGIQTAIRISAVPFEIVIARGGDAHLTAHLDADKKYSPHVTSAMCTVTRWSKQGVINICITAPGAPSISGKVHLDDLPTSIYSYILTDQIARSLEIASQQVRMEQFELSLQEMHEQQATLSEFAKVHLAPSVTITGEVNEARVIELTSLVYSTKAPIANIAFVLIVRRRVIATELVDSEWHVTGGVAEVIDAVQCPRDAADEVMTSLMAENILSLEATGENFGDLGNVHIMMHIGSNSVEGDGYNADFARSPRGDDAECAVAEFGDGGEAAL